MKLIKEEQEFGPSNVNNQAMENYQDYMVKEDRKGYMTN